MDRTDSVLREAKVFETPFWDLLGREGSDNQDPLRKERGEALLRMYAAATDLSHAEIQFERGEISEEELRNKKVEMFVSYAAYNAYAVYDLHYTAEESND